MIFLTFVSGASAIGKTFTRPVIEAMTEVNRRSRPIIFALSNPTHKSECTAEEAYVYSEKKAIFASGSPFDQIDHFKPGQCNNSYIFPGLSLGIDFAFCFVCDFFLFSLLILFKGVVFAKTNTVPDEMFLIAANTVADMVSEEDKALSCVMPNMERIREVSIAVAANVVKYAIETGNHNMDVIPKIEELRGIIHKYAYWPTTDSTYSKM